MTCSLIAAVVYRNWKYEQEIAGLLWRISMKDLVELQSNNSSKNPGMFNTFGGSRLSINSQASNELCGGGQIFTVLRKYRGSVVAVKSLRFPQVRRVEIPREVKKEMKLMKEIHHGNINPFIGAVVQPNQVLIVTEYCGKGSLHDVLENDSVKLDAMFIASLVFDLINAMIYLHESFLKMHGNLKSHNCLITSRFVLQVSDFGLHHLRKTCDVVSENVDKHRKDLWKAPELLRDQTLYGSQKGDVYAFALILHEIFARNGPFGIDKNEDDDDECDEEEDDTERDEGCSSIGSTACDEEAITDAGANMELRNEGSSSLRNHQRMNRDNREGLFLRFRDERDDEKGDEEGRCRENSCREPDCSDERESHEVDQPHTQSVITKSSSCAVNALQDNRIKSGRQKRKRKLTAGDIICLVKDETRVEPFRPDVSDIEAQDFVLMTMKNCWHEDPNKRPDFRPIKESLKNMRHGLKSNVFDNMMIMMEKHNNNLEELVEERTIQLLEEKKKTEHLLHQMLPASVANDLMKGKMVTPETFEAVTIFFSDIVGFTAMCSESTPMEVVNFLHDLYQLFDDIISHYDVYKVETIGDAYMVVSGLPIKNGDKHATEIASMAIELLDNVKHFKIRHRPNDTLQLRIGIHTGRKIDIPSLKFFFLSLKRV
jgi:serine/threonine protein kinase